MQSLNGNLMRYLNYLLAVIYKSYDDRGVDIPYFRTCMTVILSLFFHTLQIGLIFNLPSEYIMPWSSNSPKSSQWLSGFLFIGFLILLFLLIFKKKNIESIELEDRVVERGRKILPVYLFLNLLFLAVLLVRKKTIG
jgi:hypothetical protein